MPARVILKCDKCGKEFRFQCNLHAAILIAANKGWGPAEDRSKILCSECYPKNNGPVSKESAWKRFYEEDDDACNNSA